MEDQASRAPRRTCDVLVLGAGPAGSALAIDLARNGFAVVLADRKAFPRGKPCGEFLGPQCRPYLRELGVDDALLQAGTRRIHGMRLFGNRHAAHGRFEALPDAPHSTAGYAVRREVFDQHLLDAARQRPEVEWLERHEFRSLLRAADGTVTGAVLRDAGQAAVTVSARWVVGADGVHSRVARQLGLQRPLRWLDRIALVARFGGVVPRAEAEVHFVADGYFAATTVDDGSFHLNLVTDRARLGAHRGDVDAFVASRIDSAVVLRDRLRHARRTSPWRGTGPLAFTTRKQVVAGAALVGDACGYVDPLTGEGIFFALHGARTLAAALVEARDRPSCAAAAMRRYQAQRRAEVGPRLWLAWLLQRGLRQVWLREHVLALLSARPRLCDLLVTMTGDSIHPRDLARPAFWRQWHRGGHAVVEA